MTLIKKTLNRKHETVYEVVGHAAKITGAKLTAVAAEKKIMHYKYLNIFLELMIRNPHLKRCGETGLTEVEVAKTNLKQTYL